MKFQDWVEYSLFCMTFFFGMFGCMFWIGGNRVYGVTGMSICLMSVILLDTRIKMRGMKP